MVVVDGAVGYERGERRALFDEEVGFPARRSPVVVEPRLVGKEPAVDVRYSELRELRREPVKPGARERRVAEALQEDVAVPDRSFLPAGSEHLGAEAIRGPEVLQRGKGDRQLLVRGGLEGEPRMTCEEHLAVLQVDCNGSAGCGGVSTDGQRVRESRRERKRPARRVRYHSEREHDDEERPTHGGHCCGGGGGLGPVRAQDGPSGPCRRPATRRWSQR